MGEGYWTYGYSGRPIVGIGVDIGCVGSGSCCICISLLLSSSGFHISFGVCSSAGDCWGLRDESSVLLSELKMESWVPTAVTISPFSKASTADCASAAACGY